MIGFARKASAHERGLLHRAFSVFVMNGAGEWLLQRRAAHKYHSGGLSSNTCCSHPRPGEAVEDAAPRRLREEMGFDCALEPLFSFVYRAELDNGMIEHELDHVFLGIHEGDPVPDPDEVAAWRWSGPDRIRRALADRPAAFTAWFALAFYELGRSPGRGADGPRFLTGHPRPAAPCRRSREDGLVKTPIRPHLGCHRNRTGRYCLWTP